MKTLCKEVFLKSGEVISNSCSAKLKYYITNEETEDFEDSTFGIEIVKEEYFGNGTSIEARHIKNISNNQLCMQWLIFTLAKNQVTPVIFEDIIKDIIKQKNFTF